MEQDENSTHVTCAQLLRQTCWQTFAYLNIQQTQSDISIHLESCFWPPGEFSPIFTFILVSFLCAPTPEGNIWLISY